MKIALRVVAVLLIGMGVVWVLQGVNILPGSFMTGQIVWAWRGAATAIVGILILLISTRIRSRI